MRIFVEHRHGHLMLYDDSEQLVVRHVVSLSHHKVSIYGGGDKIPEGELYIRRNAICLTRKDVDSAAHHDNESLSKPFYLFSENCSEKEDFYFALLKNQERSPDDDQTSESPSPLGFDPAHLILLIQNLHSSEEQYQTRWINALLGRLFLAFYKTPDLEKFFKNKIDKKIARVKKPAFLSDVVIQKVDVGEGAPFITNPRLRELTVDGETIVEANVTYSGGFRIVGSPFHAPVYSFTNSGFTGDIHCGKDRFRCPVQDERGEPHASCGTQEVGGANIDTD